MAKKVLVEQIEDEFTCIICQELFIQATTLPCSHSFCDYCLKSWLKKQKTCPMCRKDIKGNFVRSIVLDSAVEKMVETMDDETKARRRAVVEERKKKGIGRNLRQKEGLVINIKFLFVSSSSGSHPGIREKLDLSGNRTQCSNHSPSFSFHLLNTIQELCSRYQHIPAIWFQQISVLKTFLTQT